MASVSIHAPSTLSGTPTQLLNDVAADSALVAVSGQFAFSNTGTFVYLSGKSQDPTYPIFWLDASGKVTPVVLQPGTYRIAEGVARWQAAGVHSRQQ